MKNDNGGKASQSDDSGSPYRSTVLSHPFRRISQHHDEFLYKTPQLLFDLRFVSEQVLRVLFLSAPWLQNVSIDILDARNI